MPSDRRAAQGDGDDAPYPAPAYAWYVVGVLTLAYVSSFVDRQILGLLVAPIRRDLGISDTGMSHLMGLSFAVFYTVLGLPIARLADARSRRGIIAWGIAVWSVATVCCGFARSYSALLLARVGVGVGEAALSPPAHSLTSDYFPPDRLATAISVYSLGIYLGSGLANLVGGALIDVVTRQEAYVWPLVGAVRPWQTVFFVVGLPGMLVALLMLTVREPARRGAAAGRERIPLGEVASYVAANRRTFACTTLGIALFALANYGTAAWLPTFFVRTHGWTAGRAGITLGLLTATIGVAGIVCGGRLADHLTRRGRTDAKLRVCVLAAAAQLPLAAWYTLAPTGEMATWALAPFNFFAAFPFGAAAAAVQEIVPNRMRAQASALYLFVGNLVGLGIGPTAVALVTDRVFGDDARLGASLLVVSLAAYGLSLVLLATGLAPFRESVRFRERWVAREAAAIARAP